MKSRIKLRGSWGRGVVLASTLFLTLAAAGAEGLAPEQVPGIVLGEEEAANLLESYCRAINSFDSRMVAALYDEDARIALVYPGGEKLLVKGREAIEDFYAKMFAQNQAHFREFKLEPTRLANPAPPFGSEASTKSETLPLRHHFVFSGKPGSPLILRQLLESEFMPELPSSPLVDWADEDGNGILAPLEQALLVEFLRRFKDGRPRPVQRSLDRCFDFDRDLAIDDVEAAIAGSSLLRDTMRRLAYAEGRAAETFFGGAVTIHEANRILGIAFFRDPENESQARRFLEPGESLPEDLDGDGVLRLYEIDAFARLVLGTVALYPEMPLYHRDAALTGQGLRLWSDLDGNGRTEKGELTDLGWETMEVQRVFDWNPADSLALRFFDTDGNSLVEEAEALRARAFIFDYLFSRVHRDKLRGLRSPKKEAEPFPVDLDRDGAYDRQDAELLASLLLSWGKGEPPESLPAFVFSLADENRDGRIEAGEFNRFCNLGWSAAASAWLEAPEEELAAFREEPEAFLSARSLP